jgi:hypothetical protein
MRPNDCRAFPAFQGGPAAFYSRTVVASAPQGGAHNLEPPFASRPRNFARWMPRADVVQTVSRGTLLWPPPGEASPPPQITHS